MIKSKYKGLRVVSIFFVLLGLSGCGTVDRLLDSSAQNSLSQLLNKTTVPATNAPATTPESKKVSVFFPDATGKLVSREVQIPKTLSLARETVNQLLKGPGQGADLQGVIPQGTKLLDINIKNQTAIVDLSKEFLKATKPELAVYSVVNTLTQFSTIKAVQIKVEGKFAGNLGNVDLGETFTRNMAAVKKHPITQKPIATSDSTVKVDN